MKTCLALTLVLLAEGRGLHPNGHGAPLIHGVPLSHVAVAINESHVIVNRAADSRRTAVTGKIVPPLVDVDTDKKFFGPPFPADYPDDISPPAQKNLFKKGWVYPKVQDDFDKDYVKDENSDGGKWQAQHDYDAARTKLANEKRQRENARKRGDKEAHDAEDAGKVVDEAQQKEEEAARKNKAAEDEEREAADRVKYDTDAKVAQKEAEDRAKAEEEERRRKHEDAHNVLEKKVADAERELEQEKESYKDCLKELQDAKARVEAIKAQRKKLKDEADSKVMSAAAENPEKEMRAAEEARRTSEAAEAKHQDAEKRLEAAHKKKDDALHELDKQKGENEEAQAAVEREAEDVKEAEHDLEESRSNLRRMRGIEAVPGATPRPPKGGAASMTMSLIVAVACVTSLAF